MPSTHSYDSHVSWNPDQIWGHQHLQHVGCLDYGTSAESHRDGHDALENEPRNQDFNSACSSKSETSSDKQGPAPMEKFSSPHCCARFGPGGLFIQVLPNLPSEGKPALVNIHSTEVMLHGLWDQVDLKTFPGPFTKDKTDKAEVLRLIKNKCHKCVQNDTSTDEGTSSLIWDLMRLICRQNGKLVGTDVSHLLLSNQRSHCSLKEATSDLIDFTHEPFSRAQEIHMGIAESTTEDTQRDLQHFRELLIIGKKKDALKTAVSKGLWEHAFMLASKMDSVAYSQVMSKFIDSLPESDALRTFYQLMSGRIPVSASNCRFKEHEDWRIHLAMVLSNHTCFKHLHKKTITKMADTLASNGCCTAASFCYMVSQLDVDTQSYKSDVFLFGVSPNVPHLKYATNEAIQRTELFEYSLCLGTNSVHLPNFQIFKFIYACRLAEAGLCTQALQYCEVIANTLLTSGAGSYLTLVNQLLELSAKIRLFDQQLKDISEPELQHEPEWIVNLKILRSQMIEQLNSTSREEQTESTDVVPRGSPGEPAVLTTEMPKHEGSPPQVQLALPASQDEIRTKVAPVESWQVLDSDPPEPDNKALPVPTVTSTGCLVSHKPSPRANANSLAEGVPTLAKESNATSELQLLTVPSSAALPDKLAHTEDCWSEDRPKLTTETVGSLLLPLLAPSTFQQGRPVNAVPTTQSQYTENHHNLSVNTDSVSAEFTLRPSSLSSATLPSLVTEPGTVPQITAPLPYTPSFAQTGQPCQSQYPIPPLSLSVAPPPMSSGSVNWVTEQYLRDLPPVLPASPPLLYEPLAWQPLTPAVSDDRFQAVYTMESQTAPHPTTPLPAAHISPPDTSAPSAEPSQREAWTQFTPLVTAPLPADHMLSQKTPPLFGKKPHVMAEGTAHPGQMPAAPKPFTPKLFVPQSPVPDPQPEKDAGGGWFRWLFGKKSEVPLVTDTDKADVPNTKR
ncbi:uncharacterized protein LOC143509251 [Brachyhypopomus gauderio]|uniref:uncharacterized protein LOC143509251 n=1 Tax=Brachyhypopomus gauderio TaxID=698409 RepID=UPI00404267DA